MRDNIEWWRWVWWHRHKHHPRHRHRRITGRFSGAYWYDLRTGEIKVAVQQVPVSTALTGSLVFTDSNGNLVKGPQGSISADNPAVTPTLSADGQFYNFNSPASGDVTLTWHDPAGNVADFSQTFSDVVPPVTVTGAFGPASPGTTP